MRQKSLALIAAEQHTIRAFLADYPLREVWQGPIPEHPEDAPQGVCQAQWDTRSARHSIDVPLMDTDWYLRLVNAQGTCAWQSRLLPGATYDGEPTISQTP